jgi:hypothetical protein
MVEKWYRGHEGSKRATDNFGIIWLADDPDYAQLYANEYTDGIVSTIFVDMDKVDEFDWYYDENFDPYDPDMSLVKEYMNEDGANAYTFTVNDGVTVLALLSEEPIVKVSLYNDIYSTMKSDNIEKIGLDEIRYMVEETIKRIIKDNKPVLTESYKPIGGGYEFMDENGIKRTSVVTIQSQNGQMCHIAEDDHCYLLFNDCGSGKNCTHIKWIFPEALKALQMLPLP